MSSDGSDIDEDDSNANFVMGVLEIAEKIERRRSGIFDDGQAPNSDGLQGLDHLFEVVASDNEAAGVKEEPSSIVDDVSPASAAPPYKAEREADIKEYERRDVLTTRLHGDLDMLEVKLREMPNLCRPICIGNLEDAPQACNERVVRSTWQVSATDDRGSSEIARAPESVASDPTFNEPWFPDESLEHFAARAFSPDVRNGIIDAPAREEQFRAQNTRLRAALQVAYVELNRIRMALRDGRLVWVDPEEQSVRGRCMDALSVDGDQIERASDRSSEPRTGRLSEHRAPAAAVMAGHSSVDGLASDAQEALEVDEFPGKAQLQSRVQGVAQAELEKKLSWPGPPRERRVGMGAAAPLERHGNHAIADGGRAARLVLLSEEFDRVSAHMGQHVPVKL